MANTTSYNRNALLTLDTLRFAQKMPAHVSKVTLFWRCLRTCCIYPSRTQIAQPSGHFLGQVAVQNRPQRRLQDILAALRVRVTDFGPQSPPRDPWGVRVRVPHFSSTNAIKCPSKGRVLNPLAPVSFFVGTSEIRGDKNRPKCQKHV